MTSAALDRLKAGARSILGDELSERAAGQFDKYLELLVKWQKRHRLIGSTDAMWVVDHLFLDSLLFLRVLPQSARDLVDIGSGAGFPGYPLKIVRPEIRLALIERREARASFLRTVARELTLEDVTILNDRVDVAADTLSGQFDAAVMRCAGPRNKLLPEALRLLVAGGLVVVASGPSERGSSSWRRLDVEGVAKGSTRTFIIHSRQENP